MTFELQHSDIPQPKLFDIDPVSDGPWPLPAAKPWAPASAIDQMCDQAMASIGESIEQAADRAWLQHCQKFRITHRMHVAADGTKTVLLCGEPWPSTVSEESFNWHAESDAIWYFEPKDWP